MNARKAVFISDNIVIIYKSENPKTAFVPDLVVVLYCLNTSTAMH
jgi:hypothetical protein